MTTTTKQVFHPTLRYRDPRAADRVARAGVRVRAQGGPRGRRRATVQLRSSNFRGGLIMFGRRARPVRGRLRGDRPAARHLVGLRRHRRPRRPARPRGRGRRRRSSRSSPTWTTAHGTSPSATRRATSGTSGRTTLGRREGGAPLGRRRGAPPGLNGASRADEAGAAAPPARCGSCSADITQVRPYDRRQCIEVRRRIDFASMDRCGGRRTSLPSPTEQFGPGPAAPPTAARSERPGTNAGPEATYPSVFPYCRS